VFVSPAVAEPFFRRDAGVWWRHGYTYGGHGAAAAAALVNLDVIEHEGLLDEATRLESTLQRALSPLAEHPAVEEVRSGVGALAAVQLAGPAEALALAKGLRAHGVATRAVGAGGIQFSPALVMSDDQVHALADAMWSALESDSLRTDSLGTNPRGSGSLGSGTAGSGTAGSGTAGSGTAGSLASGFPGSGS
jgi:adenosylmethionine-8-amino-7-oxononanoate aminotransferase